MDIHPNPPENMSAKERIQHAAVVLISQQGLSGVTMSSLAKAAGVSRQTLYNNYPDVDSVVADAVDTHNQESLQHLDDSLALCSTPGDRLTQLVRHFAAIGAHGHTGQWELGLSAAARKHLSTYEAAIHDRIGATVVAGVTNGEFRSDLDPETDTALVFALLKGVQDQASTKPENAAAVVATGTRTLRAALVTH